MTTVVQSFVKNDHLLGRPLDDEISRRAMKSYLEGLDPRKMYFFQSDVDEFKKRETLLDDDVLAGRVDFAYVIFKRFLQRVDERTAKLPEIVNQTFDFSQDERMATDPELIPYARNEEEMSDRWRQLIKYSLLVAKADKQDEKKSREKLLKRYRTIDSRWHQTDSDELLERFLSAVTTSFDPHTTYMSPSTLDNFQILMRLNLDGIGAALQLSEDGYTEVTKIIPRGAADKQGELKAKDRIVSVGQGETGEMVDVLDMKLNDVVHMIRGKAGSLVRLGVQAPDSSETKIVKITRARIELEDSAARSAIRERKRTDGAPVRIGVIDLPSFYMDMAAARESDGTGAFRSTTRDVARILEDFSFKKVDLVVLDLRQNGGGSLTEAVHLTGLFVGGGPIVQVKDSTGRIQPHEDPDPGMAWSGPLVVLTSKFSASASEILAGAVQDYHRGLVVGDESTHGKGTVQSLLELGSQLFRIPNPPNLGALKITMQQFYRPNGDSTQKRGVLADIALPSVTNLIGLGESELDYAIEFDRVPPGRFAPYGMVPADTLARLRSRSEARIRESKDFSELRAEIARYEQYRKEKSVPLNEKKFMDRRASEKNAEKQEEKHLEEQSGAKGEVFPDDFENREILDIAADYLAELSQKGELVAVHSRTRANRPAVP